MIESVGNFPGAVDIEPDDTFSGPATAPRRQEISMPVHTSLDTNGDGRPDVWLSSHDPSAAFADHEAIDTNYDGTPDKVLVDTDHTGYADTELLDTNLDGHFDYHGEVAGDGISMDLMTSDDPWAVDEHTSNQLFHE